jgi:autotransporter-associated beta strand protein
LELGGGGSNGGASYTFAPSAANTYGSMRLTNGSVVAGNAFAFSTGALINNGGTMKLNGYSFSFANLSGAGGNIQNSSTASSSLLTVGADGTSTTFAGTLTDGSSQSLALTKIGSGQLTLNGANTYTGPTTINGGTLQLYNASAFASPISVAANTTLALSSSGTSLMQTNAAISGSGLIQVASSNGNTVSLAGNDSGFVGTVAFPSGQWILAWSGTAAGSAAAEWDIEGSIAAPFNLASPTIQLGALTGANPATLLGGWGGAGTGVQTFQVGALGTSTTFAGQIVDAAVAGFGGTVALNKVGSGTLTLTGSNTYSGGTTINNGVLQLGNSAALGSGPLVANGGTLDLAGYSVTVPSFRGAAGVVATSVAGLATLTVNQTTATSFNGSINDGAGQLALTLQGGGTLTLSGTNTYTGGTIVSNGTVILTSNEAIEDGTNLTIGNPSAFIPAPVVPGAVVAGLPTAPQAAIAPVPEPSTLVLLAAVLGSAAGYRRLRRR